MSQSAFTIGMLGMKYTPGEELFPYQHTWVEDESRLKFGLMSRQVGKDFSCAFEGVRECFRAEFNREKIDWLIAAPSERQSLESLQKWKDWAEVYKLALASFEVKRESGPEYLLTSATIRFRHGSRVIAVPGKPDTVRGYSANVLLTEFAFFEDPDATWRAILPTITNPLRGGQKKVRIITTPNGIGNKAHDLWVKNYRPEARSQKSESRIQDSDSCILTPAPQWSCHLVDIHRAVAEGLPVNIEELKAALDDPEGWAQEFECQFLDAQSILLPYELIAACESPDATASVPHAYWQGAAASPHVMGIDFGRRHDLTVAWTLRQVGDVHQTVEVLEMDRTPTPEQIERLRPRLRKARRVCVDYTGPGIGLGDFLVKEFTEWDPEKHKYGKIELCNFTNALKLEIFSKLRMTFEKRGVRVPVNSAIREDLHSINRVSSPTGQITYRASHSADGHADRCTALALALRAAGDGVIRGASASIKLRPAVGDMGVAHVKSNRWPM